MSCFAPGDPVRRSICPSTRAFRSKRVSASRDHLFAPSRSAPYFLAATSIVLLLLSACGRANLDRGSFQQTVGRATFYDIAEEVPLILGDNGYAIDEALRTKRIVSFTTNWRRRAPFEDEAEQGAKLARTRLVVEGRKSVGRTYTLRIRAENEVQGIPDPSGSGNGGYWSTIASTPMFRDYIRELSMEIMIEVDAGVRVF